MSDEHVLMTTNPRRAWHDGRAAGRAEVAVVLLDLIAELRAMPAACDVCCDAPGELAADRAEARPTVRCLLPVVGLR